MIWIGVVVAVVFGVKVADGLSDVVEAVVLVDATLDVATDALVLLEVVGAGEDADGELLDGDGVASGAGGGITLKLAVAPH